MFEKNYTSIAGELVYSKKSMRKTRIVIRDDEGKRHQRYIHWRVPDELINDLKGFGRVKYSESCRNYFLFEKGEQELCTSLPEGGMPKIRITAKVLR